MKNIKAILFDSGRVLNEPRTGHWFITPNFWEYVDRNAFETIDRERVALAFREADKYIVTKTLITTKEEEYRHFVRFYEIFASQLPELRLTCDKIENIAKDLVFNSEKYVFYDDAIDAISKLRGKYKLAIVSDAWPSLLDVYEKNNLTDCFDAIVISSFLGTFKPDEKMYLSAIEQLRIKPEEAIFVDDSLKNCMGATKVGINSVLLCRNKQAYVKEKIKSIGKGYTVINSLTKLLTLL